LSDLYALHEVFTMFFVRLCVMGSTHPHNQHRTVVRNMMSLRPIVAAHLTRKAHDLAVPYGIVYRVMRTSSFWIL